LLRLLRNIYVGPQRTTSRSQGKDSKDILALAAFATAKAVVGEYCACLCECCVRVCLVSCVCLRERSLCVLCMCMCLCLSVCLCVSCMSLCVCLCVGMCVRCACACFGMCVCVSLMVPVSIFVCMPICCAFVCVPVFCACVSVKTNARKCRRTECAQMRLLSSDSLCGVPCGTRAHSLCNVWCVCLCVRVSMSFYVYVCACAPLCVLC